MRTKACQSVDVELAEDTKYYTMSKKYFQDAVSFTENTVTGKVIDNLPGIQVGRARCKKQKGILGG